ncbi:GDSL esterase/lipase At1g28570 [Linum perenne]
MGFPQFFLSILAALLLFHPLYAAPDLKPCGFTAIYCFGDSIYDTGNSIIEFPHSWVGNYPYGITIGRATGRTSDGLLIVDHIAEAIGVPYLNPSLNKSLDFSKGANFAVGGTALLSKAERKRWNVTLKWSNSSLPVQLTWFKHLVKQSYQHPAGIRRLKMKSSLFMLGGGSADYYNCHASYKGPPINQKKQLLPYAIGSLKQAVKTIRRYGGKYFVISGVYEGGCQPGAYNDTFVHCDKYMQEWHVMHNKALKTAILKWAKEFPDLHLVYGDIWSANQWVFDNAKSNGIVNVNTPCCGFARVTCGEFPNTPMCKKPYEYVFWDWTGHLTDHSYRMMSAFLIPQISQGLHCANTLD